MMVSLFSSFDPTSSMALATNWVSICLILLVIPRVGFFVSSKVSNVLSSVVLFIHSEVKMLSSGGYCPGISSMFLGLLLLIAGNNFLGLFPYVFTATSHMVVTLSLALPLWFGFMLYGWCNHTMHMFAHLVPLGTPAALMSFMVLIESVSNIIRPITLSVRLAANMIAGHLLLTLLGNQGPGSPFSVVGVVVLSSVALLVLEAAVALIQSYVFMILSVLYASETS